jgi:hypothetical protein
VLGQMRGTFALSNSISAHTSILVFVAYKLGAIAINKRLRLLLPKNYVTSLPACWDTLRAGTNEGYFDV